jgi:hypothetical protein
MRYSLDSGLLELQMCLRNLQGFAMSFLIYVYIIFTHLKYTSISFVNVFFCMYFTLAAGCPHERIFQKSISHFIFWRIVQNTDTERCPNSGSLACQMSEHSYTGPRFKSHLINNFSLPARESNPKSQDNKSNRLSYVSDQTILCLIPLITLKKGFRTC